MEWRRHPYDTWHGNGGAQSSRQRRNKTASERRQQQRRSDARFICKVTAGLNSLANHRGSRLSRVGAAMKQALRTEMNYDAANDEKATASSYDDGAEAHEGHLDSSTYLPWADNLGGILAPLVNTPYIFPPHASLDAVSEAVVGVEGKVNTLGTIVDKCFAKLEDMEKAGVQSERLNELDTKLIDAISKVSDSVAGEVASINRTIGQLLSAIGAASIPNAQSMQQYEQNLMHMVRDLIVSLDDQTTHLKQAGALHSNGLRLLEEKVAHLDTVYAALSNTVDDHHASACGNLDSVLYKTKCFQDSMANLGTTVISTCVSGDDELNSTAASSEYVAEKTLPTTTGLSSLAEPHHVHTVEQVVEVPHVQTSAADKDALRLVLRQHGAIAISNAEKLETLLTKVELLSSTKHMTECFRYLHNALNPHDAVKPTTQLLGSTS